MDFLNGFVPKSDAPWKLGGLIFINSACVGGFFSAEKEAKGKDIAVGSFFSVPPLSKNTRKRDKPFSETAEKCCLQHFLF